MAVIKRIALRINKATIRQLIAHALSSLKWAVPDSLEIDLLMIKSFASNNYICIGTLKTAAVKLDKQVRSTRFILILYL